MSCRAKQPPKCSVWLHHSETPASDPSGPSGPSGPQTSVSTIAFQILLRDEHPHQVNHRVAGSFDLYTINTLLMVEIVLSNAFKWSYRIWKWVVEHRRTMLMCFSFTGLEPLQHTNILHSYNYSRTPTPNRTFPALDDGTSQETLFGWPRPLFPVKMTI